VVRPDYDAEPSGKSDEVGEKEGGEAKENEDAAKGEDSDEEDED